MCKVGKSLEKKVSICMTNPRKIFRFLNFYCISKTLSIFMGGENVGFLKIGMSPTLNLFAQNVSLVRVRVKTTKWLTWWTNFNGRGKCEWSLWSCIFKFPIFHAQISHHRLYDQIRYSDFFWLHLDDFTKPYFCTVR